MGHLEGKVAAISGTANGQGRVALERFRAEGAIVVGGDIRSDDDTPYLDVTDEASVRDWIETAVQRHGRIDILYANAGAVRFGAVDTQSFEDWRFTLAAELDSVFLCAKYAWPHLKKTRGTIITVGSTAGLTGSVTNDRVAHSASKGGVIAATRQLAAEGARHGITANCISPGMIVTPGSQENLLAPDHPMRDIASAIPLGRLGTAEDVVNVAVFLASDAAAYVTGANVVVDGGWSIVLPG
ncbi:MAG TPA: SDR family NAD(P)-dependent oxidoreductase [Microbacterium sp.]|uniref:SDR family oxidoreductase n=1 Tax=Microbacterium sp. TaxID=51671 RepID=UPI002C9D674E|nr:SDR family NAD(P)-dependent oxidoreductase [Microbacterium sp.]HWI30574.1 SDR family NAD(P)-dependent oxidoreductase [Microbacterium sp.]